MIQFNQKKLWLTTLKIKDQTVVCSRFYINRQLQDIMSLLLKNWPVFRSCDLNQPKRSRIKSCFPCQWSKVLLKREYSMFSGSEVIISQCQGCLAGYRIIIMCWSGNELEWGRETQRFPMPGLITHNSSPEQVLHSHTLKSKLVQSLQWSHLLNSNDKLLENEMVLTEFDIRHS